MDHDFIPYEEALALKELGFDKQCWEWWYSRTQRSGDLIFRQYRGDDDFCEAPLWQQAFKWFRDTHQLYHEIVLDQTTEPKFAYTISKFTGNPNDLTEKEWGWEKIVIGDWCLYRTYEEAELACLKKLIEVAKNEKRSKNK